MLPPASVRTRGPRRFLIRCFAALCLASGAAHAHDDSLHRLREAAEHGAWDPVTRALAEAERLRDADDPAGAARMLALARAAAPADPRVLGFAARLALDAAQAREADSLATLALAHDPTALGARLTRARARVAMREAAGALADFDAVLAADADRAEEHVIERAHAAWDLAGAEAALTGLETATRPGLWTPARRSLAAALERSLGRTPHPREAIAHRETAGVPPRPAAPLAAAALPDTLIRTGASWRWFAGPTEPAGAWTTLGYDESSWPSGPAPLGYGEARIITPIPDGGVPTNRWVTTYFRLRFTRSAQAAPALSALLRADYDDGFVAYVDGVEVARRGVPAGQSWGTFATNHESGTFEDVALTNPELLTPGEHVLAIELHNQAPNSSDLLWDAALIVDTTHVARTRGPYLQNATPAAISVRWRTAAPVVGRVSLGTAGGPYTLTFDETASRTEHEVRLTGLAPETSYSYAVHGVLEPAEAVSPARTFRTPPVVGAERPVRLWVVGDSGYNTLGGRQVRDAYLGWAAPRAEDLWLLLGDNAYVAGTDAEYQVGLFDQYPLTLSRSPLWSTRGNHDALYAGIDNDYYDLFTLPTAGEAGGLPSGTEAWYSFDWGPVHFVCLDSEGSSRTLASPMLQWLRADLAATSQQWVIGFWHHPPYTKGSHDSDLITDSGGRMRDMRENVVPILDSLGVDLVLTGHSHSYERSMLLRQHYGTSGTLTSAMKADSGDGRAAGDGVYTKRPGAQVAREGAVYAVNGSAAQISGGALNHPVMISSLNVFGSMVIDVDGDRLDARFLDNTGAVRDSFTIRKSVLLSTPGSDAGPRSALAFARPSPFSDRTEVGFTLAAPAHAALVVHDIGGRRVRTLVQAAFGAGSHRIAWDGRDAAGRPLAPGAYVLTLEVGGVRHSRRIIRLR